MPYDGIITRNIKDELASLLISGKIDKITQPTKDEVILHIRSFSENYKLLLSANAQFARAHITKRLFTNPVKPYNFCMVLRKYLNNAKLTSVEQIENDRILVFTFENSNELKDKEIKKLIIEMMGKHSNIILTNIENKIIDSIKHVDFEISSIREVMPGREYFIPKSDKQNPFSKIFSKNDDLPISKHIVNTYMGIATPVAKWIEKSAKSTWKDLFSEVMSSKNYVVSKDGKDFYSYPIFDEYTSFNTLSDAIDTVYNTKLDSEILNSAKNNLLSIVSHQLTKSSKKLDIVNEKIDSTKDLENLRIQGEILSANLYQLKNYISEVTLDNYYTGTPITIKLDNNISPADNLAKIFKKYNKLKNTLSVCTKQKDDLIEEINYFESLFFEIDNTAVLSDLEEIKLELQKEGFIKTPSKKENKNIKSEPIKITFDNFEIYVGKNNIQNDYLTFKIAAKNDIWLHVKNAPGSHTIIKTNGQEITQQLLEKAASLAALHSKLKNSPKVEIDYTLVKNVKKIPGAKPGMVIYNNFKTIYIEPATND